MPTVIPRLLADRVRRLVVSAAPSGAVDEGLWRRHRDAVIDRLDPQRSTEFTEGEARELIEVIAESAPGPEARASAHAWAESCDDLVAEILSCGS